MARRWLLMALLLAACWAGGCSGQRTAEVQITYLYAADVPVRSCPKLTVGAFQRDGQADEIVPRLLEQRLAKIRPMLQIQPPAGVLAQSPSTQAAAQEVTISGKVVLDAREQRGQRMIRLEGNASRPAASLVRIIDAHVEFEVRDSSGKLVAKVMAHRVYDSRKDPAGCGQFGLDRPDDPRNVQPAERAAEQTLGLCVDQLIDMLKPRTHTASVRLRDVNQPAARQGLAAARRADFKAAAEHYARATQEARDNLDLVFDLAAVQEAMGLLEEAKVNYARSAIGQSPRAQAAQAALERIRRASTGEPKRDISRLGTHPWAAPAKS